MLTVKVTWTDNTEDGFKEYSFIGHTSKGPSVGKPFSVSPKKYQVIDFGKVLEIIPGGDQTIVRSTETVLTLEIISGSQIPTKAELVPLFGKRDKSKRRTSGLVTLMNELKVYEYQKQRDYQESRRRTFKIISGDVK